MKVAVFGGSGFVGNYIINELIAQNYEVNVLVRKGSQDKVESLDKWNDSNSKISASSSTIKICFFML